MSSQPPATMDDSDSMEAQDSHARAGSTEAEDGVTLPQPSTPAHCSCPADDPVSSPLTEAPTLPSSPPSPPSPHQFKVEDGGDELEVGHTKVTPVASTAQPSTRRPRLDYCVDPEMLALLSVLDTDPKKPTTNYRRISDRIRKSAASKGSRTRASSKISSHTPRHRTKNPVRRLIDLKKEEMGHKSSSPEISEDVEIFTSGVGSGVQQTQLAPNKDVMTPLKSTLKRKHEEEMQNLGNLAITVSARTGTETEPACISAEPPSLGHIGTSCESNTGLGRARRYSGDGDTGGLETLTNLRGMVRKGTVDSNGQSTDDGDEDFESSMEDEGSSLNADGILPDEGSPKPTDENVSKKQKLSNCQALEPSITKALGESNELDVRDPRISEDAFQLINGVLCVPHGCKHCVQSRSFCDRALPCSKCQRASKECERRGGLVPARPMQHRSKQGDLSARTPAPVRLENATPLPSAEASSSRSLEILSLQNTPVAKRGRPRKSNVKGEVKSETKNNTKETKRVKPLLLSSTDFQKGKPPGIRRPEVWCETRQELCESLPYYRSYQSGCYGHDGLVHGYLIDGFASPRDYISSKVVISHSGGKSGTDDSGQRRLLTDQTIDDNTIKYLIKNMNQKWPLVLIMGNQCTNSPSKVPHRYCVMDWFKVTAAWAEKDSFSQCTRWKFRFEKLNTNVDGWWAVTPSEEPNPPQTMVRAGCPSCEKESPHIYEQGWACLNPNCKRFWMLDEVDMPPELTYTKNFLSCRTPWPEDFLQPPNSLAPPLDTEHSAHVESWGVSRPFWKGMCCPKCGRLSCRELWAGWLCPTCGFSHNPPRTIFDAARLADPHRPVYTGPAIPSNFHNEEITSRRFVQDGMTIVQYQLGDCGTVTHILANKVSNSRPEDANWLLENYQNLDMPFRRFPMKCHHSQGKLLTQQFMYNCGAPYKFIVDVNSLPFNASPPVVLKALDLIHKRVQLVHPEAQFNEVLNVGYFEKQKMDYHDDGEEGLGETVASISLGGSARMKFRVKSKYKGDRHCWTTEPEKHDQDAGSSNSIYNDENLEDEEEENSEETAEGLQTDAPTMRAKGRFNKSMLSPEEEENSDEVAAGPQTDASSMCAKGRPNEATLDFEEEENSREAATGLQMNPSSMRAKGRSNKAMLDLCLNHGDVMVMKGAGIQTHWEHTVVPTGLFRIAATARYIAHDAPEGVSGKETIKETVIDSDGSTSPLSSTKSIKLEDSTMGLDGIQTISTNGLGEPDQPEVISEGPNFSQSPVDLQRPEFTTPPVTTISQEISPISAVSLPGRGPQGLDTCTQSEASHQPSFPQNMSMPTIPIPPLETTAPRILSSHPIQSVPHPSDMGSPHPPLYTNQPGSYSGLLHPGFLNLPDTYYTSTPLPQIAPSHRPSPYGQRSTSDGRSSHLPRSWVEGKSSPIYPFYNHPSIDYAPSEAYNTPEKTNNPRNPLNTTFQKSNVHHNVFPGSSQGANELQNPLPSNETQMHLSNTSDPFQGYNSNGAAENPAASSADCFTTDLPRERTLN